MTPGQQPCSPIAHKRRGMKAAEWSVRCACGGYQTPWRISQPTVAALYAKHVADTLADQGATP